MAWHCPDCGSAECPEDYCNEDHRVSITLPDPEPGPTLLFSWAASLDKVQTLIVHHRGEPVLLAKISEAEFLLQNMAREMRQIAERLRQRR